MLRKNLFTTTDISSILQSMTDLTDINFINQLNRHLAGGGVIAFPTDTVWGLGALPNARGADAIYAIKRRPREKRLIIMSDSAEHIRPYMTDYPQAAFDLARAYWPGALTIAREIPKGAGAMVFGGVRIPKYAPFQELCGVIDGHCLATSSANISGMPPLTSADEIKAAFPDIIVIDNAYEKMGGAPSTVAIVTDTEIRIARNGAVFIPGATTI